MVALHFEDAKREVLFPDGSNLLPLWYPTLSFKDIFSMGFLCAE